MVPKKSESAKTPGAAKAKAAGTKAEAQVDFDARLARLEELVREMEDGGLGLEEAIGRYEEGVRLLAGCREVLDGFRRQVEELTRGAEAALEPYDDDPDAGHDG